MNANIFVSRLAGVAPDTSSSSEARPVMGATRANSLAMACTKVIRTWRPVNSKPWPTAGTAGEIAAVAETSKTRLSDAELDPAGLVQKSWNETVVARWSGTAAPAMAEVGTIAREKHIDAGTAARHRRLVIPEAYLASGPASKTTKGSSKMRRQRSDNRKLA